MSETKPPTSYPYLTVAKAYGVDYQEVLQFADWLDERPPQPGDWHLPHWKEATSVAWKHEQERRLKAAPLIIMSVRGDCGVIHGSVEEWQSCAICSSIIRRRLERHKCSCEERHDRPYWDCPVHGRTSVD